MSDDDHRRGKAKSQDHLRLVGDVAVEKAIKVAKSRRDPFTEQTRDWSLAIAADKRLAHRDVRIGMVLALDHCNRRRFNKYGVLVAFPGQKSLAARCAVSVRAVGYAIAALAAAGTITVKRRRRERSEYELQPPILWQEVQKVAHQETDQDVQEIAHQDDDQDRQVSAVRSASFSSKIGKNLLTTSLNTSLSTFTRTRERAAQVARLLEGATFAALPEEQATAMRRIVSKHFAGKLPPWLGRSGDRFELAMLNENQLLRALAHERGLAKNFPEMFQVFENDNEMLERLLDMNDGGRRVISTTLARTTEAAACREARNLTDGDPAPELSEAECEAIERVASLCGVDVATQLLVQFCLNKEMEK